MKFLYLVLFLFLSGFVQAQDSAGEQIHSSTLGLGEQMKFGDKSLKFKELISDSRCPADVTCIWAGEAKILVEVYDEGKFQGEEILVISGGGQGQDALNSFSSEDIFTLSGLALEPYPRTSVKLKPSDYKLTLHVKETK